MMNRMLGCLGESSALTATDSSSPGRHLNRSMPHCFSDKLTMSHFRCRGFTNVNVYDSVRINVPKNSQNTDGHCQDPCDRVPAESIHDWLSWVPGITSRRPVSILLFQTSSHTARNNADVHDNLLVTGILLQTDCTCVFDHGQSRVPTGHCEPMQEHRTDHRVFSRRRLKLS